MNEDEAFIRAIVDNPGDDTPRLVYADCLDDHDDPRGPYLRAEHEWAATHDPSERETLRQLAKKLDPVWVARVSRPPVGVCCDHVGFEKRRPPTNRIALSNLALRYDVTFPQDYQAFLLNYNAVWSETGNYHSRESYYYPLLYIFAVNNEDGSPYDGPADQLGSTWQIQQLDLAWRLEQIARGDSWPEWESPGHKHFIPFLCYAEEPDGESGWLCLGVRENQVGAMMEFGGWYRRMTFAEFLASLVPNENAQPRARERRRLFE